MNWRLALSLCAAGFSHSGTEDEWKLGTPSFAPRTSSAVHCWKTDLVNTYNAGASMDLLSPAIDLSTTARGDGLALSDGGRSRAC